MAEFDCDSNEVAKCLRSLEKQVVAAGGWLHPDVTICERAGDLSVEMRTDAGQGALLISLSHDCVAPLSSVSLDLDGDTIFVRSAADSVPSSQLEILETMIEIYNLTGKIASHRQTCLWSVFAEDTTILEKVAAGRQIPVSIEERHQDLPELDLGNRVLANFLVPRVHLQKRDVGTVSVLLPFIEYLNSHVDGYVISQGDTPEIFRSIANSQPLLPHSHECFTIYGLYDAYDSLLAYDYVETGLAFVRSIPMTIHLQGAGKIEVNSVVTNPLEVDVPAELANLPMHTPHIGKPQGGVITVSHLTVPVGSAPHSLRRILFFVIKKLSPHSNDKELTAHVANAERQILSDNVSFYEELKISFAGNAVSQQEQTVFTMIGEMANTQLEKLNSYRCSDHTPALSVSTAP